ncbi:cysteine desulfurase family protein [Microbulbifer sp. EKSA008]|uniref:cysteine desulfurase family protein n=1 Tax=unclassified Microbulbifer TaxID=2619833 RepID=UPI0012679596|nr:MULTISPECIES: cysteine desulfurase family protein [unclassified Microbulbifer]QFT55932.1 Cysteine desulfurase [Microbulbifer sp. THAF38]WHI48241.1 cysteine desulfurase family protein [Microbulbifer sp. VAAF005]
MTNAHSIEGYFDYNATTPVSEAVATAMSSALRLFANPSGRTLPSTSNRELIQRAKTHVASLLGTAPEKVFFTSGGSEANNWAIKGSLMNDLGRAGHILTTAIEHPSVLETIRYCAHQFGFEVTCLKPGPSGAVSFEAVAEAIRPDTRLISMMYANNETGVIQPVDQVARLTRSRGIPFHVDAVQAVGKRPLDVEALGADFVSFSAHKFYGPKGIGGLYIQNIDRISPLIHGGGQEMAMRSGTENLVAIAGLGEAADECRRELEYWDHHCLKCKQHLIEQLGKSSIETHINGASHYEGAISNTLNLSIPGIRGEALALLMEKKDGIVVSIGSACSNNKTRQLSPVLQGMGLSDEEIQSAIRISFGRFTSLDDIDRFVDSLQRCVAQLKSMSFKG